MVLPHYRARLGRQIHIDPGVAAHGLLPHVGDGGVQLLLVVLGHLHGDHVGRLVQHRRIGHSARGGHLLHGIEEASGPVEPCVADQGHSGRLLATVAGLAAHLRVVENGAVLGHLAHIEAELAGGDGIAVPGHRAVVGFQHRAVEHVHEAPSRTGRSPSGTLIEDGVAQGHEHHRRGAGRIHRLIGVYIDALHAIVVGDALVHIAAARVTGDPVLQRAIGVTRHLFGHGIREDRALMALGRCRSQRGPAEGDGREGHRTVARIHRHRRGGHRLNRGGVKCQAALHDQLVFLVIGQTASLAQLIRQIARSGH